MKQFIKFTFASCLGLAIAMSILIFIGLIFAGSAISSANKGDKIKLKDNSILVANFQSPIPEYTDNVDPTDPMSAFKPTKTLGVHDMAALISKAATDPKIEALLLEPKNASFGLATGDILRESLEEFRAEGKKIYAYAESMDQKTYYLLSEADSIFMNPNGSFDFRGFGAMVPHFKDMLDKLGVQMQIYYAGKFKSATEPFRLNKMSDQNRLQTREFLNDMYDSYLNNISQNRDIPVETLRDFANDFTIRTTEKAVEHGLIDAIGHRQDVEAILRGKVNTRAREKLGTLNLTEYLSASSSNKKSSKVKDKIAIVYAEGSINSGKEKPGAIQSDHYAKIFRKLGRDENIKGIVFRINSGGGSFMASEDIAHEIDLIREKGIPVISSFGDYAASGGYYIGCVADTIVCQENTLTGSIGVFGMIPNVEKLLNEKAGIHFDTVGTGKYSTSFTPFMKFSNEENAVIQEGVDDAYIKFKTHVAEERGWDISDVEEVAQGRVWSGRKAKELGLIDVLGDLEDAIELCAAKTGLEDYKKVEYPKLKDPLTLFMEKLMGGEIKANMVENEIEKYFPYFQAVKNSVETREPVAALPLIVNYN